MHKTCWFWSEGWSHSSFRMCWTFLVRSHTSISSKSVSLTIWSIWASVLSSKSMTLTIVCWPCMFCCSPWQETQSRKNKACPGSRPTASSQEEERLLTRNEKAQEPQEEHFRRSSRHADLHRQNCTQKGTGPKEKWEENKAETARLNFTSQPSQEEQGTIWEPVSQEDDKKRERGESKVSLLFKWTQRSCVFLYYLFYSSQLLVVPYLYRFDNSVFVSV